MRLVLLCSVFVLCLFSLSTRAEDAKAEPEPEGEPASEPAAEPTDEDAKGSGKPAKSAKQGGSGGNGASALGVHIPAILTLVSVAKFML